MSVCWAIIPARGGSKSIPRKNLLPLGGRPLMDYGVCAALASNAFERIVCSTDDEAIAEHAHSLGIESDRRPAELATDSALVDECVREYLLRQEREGHSLPEVVVLVQPTSPFLQPDHVQLLLAAFDRDPAAQSAHNCAEVPHNLHMWNQRTLGADGRVDFPFRTERMANRSKQRKPSMMAFGNLIAARTTALLSGQSFYAEPCVGTVIEHPFNFDLDKPADIPVAEALLKSGAIPLSHLPKSE